MPANDKKVKMIRAWQTVKHNVVMMAMIVAETAMTFARKTAAVFHPNAVTDDPFELRFGHGVTPRTASTEKGNVPPTSARLGARAELDRAYLIALGATAAAMGICVAALWVGSLWTISDVTVEGCDYYAPTVVSQRGGLIVGQEYLAVDAHTAERRIREAFPLIEGVRVTKHINGSITVTVREYTELYYTHHNRNYYIIAAEGNLVLEVSATGDVYRDMGATYVGLPPEARVRVGETLSYAYLPFGTKEEETLYDAKDPDPNAEFSYVQTVRDTVMAWELADRVTGMELSDRYAMYVILDNRIKITLGKKTDLARKLDRAARILETETPAGDLPVILDVSSESSSSIREDADLILPSWASASPDIPVDS